MDTQKIRYFIELAYNGKSFHGWQVQDNSITVQEVLNNSLSTILRRSINVVGAGRTDTGVHASYFVAHFDIDYIIDNIALTISRLNKFLPTDIVIYNIKRVNQEAHSRFDALSRTYQYNINTIKNPFLKEFSWYYRMSLNVDDMNGAAQILFDYIDFTSFSKTGTQVATNNCKIILAEWQTDGSSYIFTIKADRFLRNMVRAIVGSLIDVGLGKSTVDNFRSIIEAKNRSRAGVSVPARGLFLTGIEYDNSIYI